MNEKEIVGKALELELPEEERQEYLDELTFCSNWDESWIIARGDFYPGRSIHRLYHKGKLKDTFILPTHVHLRFCEHDDDPKDVAAICFTGLGTTVGGKYRDFGVHVLHFPLNVNRLMKERILDHPIINTFFPRLLEQEWEEEEA